jgi:surfeit locus 1 family protein
MLLQRNGRNAGDEKQDHSSSVTQSGGLSEYKRVHATGVFENEKSIFIGPRPRSTMGVTESGYFMVTPLKQNGRSIMVLRGWVPAAWKFSKLPHDGVQATLHGVVRLSENPSIFVPKNTPEKGDWYFIDVPHLACALGLPESTPLVEVVTSEEDTIQSGGKVNPTAMDILGGRTTIRTVNEEKDKESYPLAKSEGDLRHFSVMPRDHLNYALTWFSLSAATSGLAYKVIKGRGR